MKPYAEAPVKYQVDSNTLSPGKVKAVCPMPEPAAHITSRPALIDLELHGRGSPNLHAVPYGDMVGSWRWP
jgi:hypothetical protein